MRALRVLVTVACSACAVSHQGLDATAEDVRSMHDSGIDAATVGADAGGAECRPAPPPANAACTPERRLECQRWAETLVTEGYAHGSCPLGWPGWSLPCYAGHVDCDAPTGELPPPCVCGDRQCSSDEVCVSDTPDGPSVCRPRCTPSE